MIAINDAIDHGIPEGTMAAMQNPNAMLVNLDANSARQYHDTLYQAKGEKVANSRKRVRSLSTKGSQTDGWMVYMVSWGMLSLRDHKRPI